VADNKKQNPPENPPVEKKEDVKIPEKEKIFTLKDIELQKEFKVKGKEMYDFLLKKKDRFSKVETKPE
jgi:hypothetical protein